MKNQQIIGFMAGLLLFAVSTGICADVGFKSDNEFGEWLTFYYQNPSPERIPVALEYFSDSTLYKTNTAMPIAAFFSALFKKDVGLMQKVYDEISLNGSENSKIMLINILSLTNNVESKGLLEKSERAWQSKRLQGIIAQMSRPHYDLYSIPVDSPQVLDMLWASFSATGEVLPVQRIISVLHLQKEGHGEEILTGGAASWSLEANAHEHPMVLEICKNEVTKAQGITKAMLESIIQNSAK